MARAVEVLPPVTDGERVPVPQEGVADLRDGCRRAARPADLGEELHRDAAVTICQAILELLAVDDCDLPEVAAEPAGARKRRGSISCLDQYAHGPAAFRVSRVVLGDRDPVRRVVVHRPQNLHRPERCRDLSRAHPQVREGTVALMLKVPGNDRPAHRQRVWPGSRSGGW